MGVTMTGIKIAPSPDWLQQRLRAIGINPKNNVVDITNFILHETGQPLHAFDAAKIKGDKIVVRTCPEGTPFVTLDGVERKLSAEDLMICNAEGPMYRRRVRRTRLGRIGLDDDRSIYRERLFQPCLDPQTAKRHGLIPTRRSATNANRPDMTPYALRRAALLIRELAGGVVTSAVTDIYPVRIERSGSRCRTTDRPADRQSDPGDDRPENHRRARRDDRIGTRRRMAGLRTALPVDVRREADLVEDILRIYGYDNVEIPMHVNSTLSLRPKPNRDKLINMLSDTLSANGFLEIMSNSLTKAAYYENLSA